MQSNRVGEMELESKEIIKEAMSLIKQNPIINSKFDKLASEYFSNQTLFLKKEYLLYSDRARTQYDEYHGFQTYLFSLLEEIHLFSYHIAFEVILYLQRIEEEADTTFFSARFFLNNAVFKCMGAWERLVRFYGYIYGIEFDANEKKNTFVNIYRKLKKTDFKSSRFFTVIDKVRNIGLFNAIETFRKDNDHNISPHIKVANDAQLIETNIILLKHAGYLYQLINMNLVLLEENCILPSFTGIPVQQLVIDDSYNYYEKAKKLKSKISHTKIRSCNEKVVEFIPIIVYLSSRIGHDEQEILNSPIKRTCIYLSDIIFRLHEAGRSLSYAYGMFAEALELKYDNPEEYVIRFAGLNYRYFIYSALIRVYSVYDKLAHVFVDYFEVEQPKNFTFENVLAEVLDSKQQRLLPIIKKLKVLSKTNRYKEIYDSRQKYYHYLMPQNFLAVNKREVLDSEIMFCLVDNISLLIEIMNKSNIFKEVLKQLS